MSDDGEIRLRRRCPSSPPPETPLEINELLGQIHLRLPPRPSSLPRAAAVCKRWRRLVSDLHFRRSFRAYHGKAPLLGYFTHDYQCGNICFCPALDPPDSIPSARFSLPINKRSNLSGCRHGRVLVITGRRLRLLVWDPLTGAQRCVHFPRAFRGEKYLFNGAVICAAGDPGHVHGCCHSSPFQVVLLGHSAERMFACVYSSEADTWGNLVSMLLPRNRHVVSTDCINSTLVGNSICWLLVGENISILEFDLDGQSLACIEAPQIASETHKYARADRQFMITPSEGGGLGFLVLSGFSIRLWRREADSDGAVGWALKHTIEVSSLVSLRSCVGTSPPEILGLAEDENVIFLLIYNHGIFMLNLESNEVKKVPDKRTYGLCYPFTSFYTSGMGIGGESDGVEIVHNA